MRKEKRQIGGVTYEMEQLGVFAGNAAAVRLWKPAIALMEALRSGGDKLNEAKMIASARAILGELRPSDVNFLLKKFARKTTVWMPDGSNAPKPWPLFEHGNLDKCFGGKLEDQIEFLKWGIELNRFFESALELIKKLGGDAASKSASHRASTGSGGDSSAARPG